MIATLSSKCDFQKNTETRRSFTLLSNQLTDQRRSGILFTVHAVESTCRTRRSKTTYLKAGCSGTLLEFLMIYSTT